MSASVAVCDRSGIEICAHSYMIWPVLWHHCGTLKGVKFQLPHKLWQAPSREAPKNAKQLSWIGKYLQPRINQYPKSHRYASIKNIKSNENINLIPITTTACWVNNILNQADTYWYSYFHPFFFLEVILSETLAGYSVSTLPDIPVTMTKTLESSTLMVI